MGRRIALNGLADLLTGFNQGYNTVGQVVQDKKLGDIANATPQQSQGFTAEDGQQLEAIANAKDQNGNPYYKLTANPDGSYTVADANNPSSSGVIAQHGVTDFLGQRTNGQMTDGQVENARMRAAAGVIGATDPVAGMRMRRDIMANDREDQRFAWEKDRTERDLRLGAQKEEDDQQLRAIDADAGEWLTNRLKGPDGKARAANIDDHLAATQYRAAKLAEAGKLNDASAAYRDYSTQSAAKIQLETQQRDLAIGKTAAALASGDLDSVKDFYNQFIPDGAHVTDVQRGKDGSITIQRETLDGRKLAPTVMKDTGQLVSALAAFKDPMAIYNYAQNEFRNNLALHASQRADASSAIENQLRTAQLGEITEKTNDRKDLSKLHDDLNAALDAGDTNGEALVRKKLMSYTTGKGMQHMSALEQKANLYLASGKAKTMADALDLANMKVQSSPKDDYLKLTTGAMPLSGDQLETAMTTLHGDNWKDKVRSDSPDGGAPKPKPLKAPPTDADIKNTAKKYNISEAEVRRRLGI